MQTNVVKAGTAVAHSLGRVDFRILAEARDNDGAFSVLEFRGEEGPWTVPHIHKAMEESFYILEGSFVFTVDGQDIEASEGNYILVPRGVSHGIRAGAGGARLLCFAVPAGLEEMFRELSSLPADSITDPDVRARISSRYDSTPVAD